MACLAVGVFLCILLFAFAQGCDPLLPQGDPLCQVGPCDCVSIETVLLHTEAATLVTTVTFKVTNYCNQPFYFAAFGIDGLTVQTPANGATYYGKGSVLGTYKVSYPTTIAGSPSFTSIKFTASDTATSNRFSNGNSDLFTIDVKGYSPNYIFNLQGHAGDKWDTYASDFALCPCDNCNAGSNTRQVLPCVLGYPSSPPSPLGSVVFNENEVLRGYRIQGSWLQVFENDEHCLTLGVRQINIITSAGTTTKNYPLTPLTVNPSCIDNPNIGASALSGDEAGIDALLISGQPPTPNGRPMYPSLFITDITNDPNSRIGDWQYGGLPTPPHRICGTWKGAVRTIDKRTSPWTYTTKPDPNPTNPGPNNWNLGAGSDPPLPGLVNEGWGAELVWNLDLLGLQSGHKYRFQFMVHDGDQTKTGGDVGQACIIASSACPSGFSGTECNICDTAPAPGYSTWCQPIYNGNQITGYQFLKIPSTDIGTAPYVAPGFVPSADKVDGDGYTVTCDCQRVTYPCPNQCSGRGFCNDQNGTCVCQPGFDGVDCSTCTTSTSCCDVLNDPSVCPCYNQGQFCSGFGVCDTSVDPNGQCVCEAGRDGTACEVRIDFTCANFFQDCSTCINIGRDSHQLDCVWCSQAVNGGQCVATADCPAAAIECGGSIDYVAPPCPDDCNVDKGYGNCTNGTCVCASTRWEGINCGSVKGGLSTAAKAGIGAGAIAGIVIACVVLAIIIGIATKKGIDWAQLNDMAQNPGYDSPLHVPAGSSATNPLAGP